MNVQISLALKKINNSWNRLLSNFNPDLVNKLCHRNNG
jgi:hypothetical protein